MNNQIISYKFWLKLNETQSFERGKDPLSSLDIGQSHLNKIKKINFYFFNVQGENFEMRKKTPKELGFELDDNIIKEKSKEYAKKLLKNCNYSGRIHIRYFDKKDDVIEDDVI